MPYSNHTLGAQHLPAEQLAILTAPDNPDFPADDWDEWEPWEDAE